MCIKKGTPVIFFVTPANTRGARPKKAIDEVETYLIRQECKRNQDLCNQKKTAPDTWNIRGINDSKPGHPTKEETIFKKMMGI